MFPPLAPFIFAPPGHGGMNPASPEDHGDRTCRWTRALKRFKILP